MRERNGGTLWVCEGDETTVVCERDGRMVLAMSLVFLNSICGCLGLREPGGSSGKRPGLLRGNGEKGGHGSLYSTELS